MLRHVDRGPGRGGWDGRVRVEIDRKRGRGGRGKCREQERQGTGVQAVEIVGNFGEKRGQRGQKEDRKGNEDGKADRDNQN